MASSKLENEGEKAILDVINAMSDDDKQICQKLHQLIKSAAPTLTPRTWYGMPAYTLNGKVICFFRSRAKFGERYVTLGFNDSAKLDEGHMWPTYYALTNLTKTEEERIKDLVERSIS